MLMLNEACILLRESRELRAITHLTHTIIRSKRKSLALVINKEGELIVRAPLRMPTAEITAFIEQKQGWILKKQQQIKAAGARYQSLTLTSGESIPFLGEPRTLVVDSVSKILLTGDTLLIPKNATKEMLVAWMKKQARTVITRRVRHYAALMGVEYSAIKMSSAQARWGSCSAQNSLNFAWRLVMCPEEIIDYVVVHELAHITQKNHGAQFWAQVESVLPRYKKHRAWLKTNRKILELP